MGAFVFSLCSSAIAAIALVGCASAPDDAAFQTDDRSESVAAPASGVTRPNRIENPFSDPPRCTNRPIRIDGVIVENDPRGEWCEFGACGQSRKATCRTLETRTLSATEQGPNGVRCVSCTYRRLECGTTDGCISHDACYDERFKNNDQGSQDLFWALRAYCDAPIAALYSRDDWTQWLQGKPGPSGFSKWLPYSELVGCTETASACAPAR